MKGDQLLEKVIARMTASQVVLVLLKKNKGFFWNVKEFYLGEMELDRNVWC